MGKSVSTKALFLLLVAPVTRGQESLPVNDASLREAGLIRFWNARLPVEAGDALETGYLVDDALYVISEGGAMFALEANTGLIRWADKITVRDDVIRRPAHLRSKDQSGPVVFATSKKVFLRDRFSGDNIVSFAPEFSFTASVVGTERVLFLGSLEGRMYAMRLPRAEERILFPVWMVQTGGAITASPQLVDDETLLFASQDGRAYLCRTPDKQLIWNFESGAAIVGSPTADSSGAYVSSMDRSIYKIGLKSGRELWRVRTQRPLTTGPVVAGDAVYQHVTNQGLGSIDADSGKERWWLARARSLVSQSHETDVLFTEDRQLLIVDHASGEPRHAIPLVEAADAAVNIRDDAIYVLGRKGDVVCARVDNVPYLRRQQVQAAEARLTMPPQKQPTAGPENKRGDKPVDPRLEDPLRSRRDSP